MINEHELKLLENSLFRFTGKDAVSGMTFVFQNKGTPELVIIDKQADSIRSQIRLHVQNADGGPFIESANPQLNYKETFEIKSVEFRDQHLLALHLKSDRGQEYQLKASGA